MTDFLYPALEPFAEHDLAVTDVHTVHYEQCGNPKGKPVLFVHGGPGSGIDPSLRRFFHPDKYHIILVDQRGCGKSTPHASIADNHTDALISDFEQIREACGVDQWMVFGGSWGSTLGLAYAQAHPERVTEMVLRGIFLGSDAESQWLFGGKGANALFPDAFEDFIGIIPESERDNLLAAYYKRLTSSCQKTVAQAARAFSQWEFRIATLYANEAAVQSVLNSPAMLSVARLECHYMNHGCFLTDNQLLDNMHKIQHIPGYIVHGRYDVVCAPQQAWRLHQHWPGSELSFVIAGHSMKDEAIAKALVAITDRLISR